MKKYIAIASLALLLTGCVSTYPTYDAKGNESTFISCPLLYQFRCFDQAKRICPAGYKINSEQSGFDLFVANHTINVTCNKKGR